MMLWLLLFCLGLALGSFLHVLASRYDPERFLVTRHTVGGRSHCPHCKEPLRWHELIPLLSFLLQRGRCRRCKAAIGWSYFWVELASGLITAYVPFYTMSKAYALPAAPLLASIWTAAFLVLLIITVIDLRLYLIPDELVVALATLGAALMLLNPAPTAGFAFGPGGSMIGFQGAIPWVNHLSAAVLAALFFGTLVLITRGRGMGIGDVKLGAALGLLFGWPGTLFLVMLAFIFGAIVGIGLLTTRRKTMKSVVPFAPFLALGALAAFFYGPVLLGAYFNAFYP